MISNREARGIFIGDYAGGDVAFFSRNIPLPIIGFHLPIGINDVRQQLSRTLSANARERGADIAETDRPQFMADRAGARKEDAAGFGVSRLLNFGKECRNNSRLFFARKISGTQGGGGFH